MVERAGSATAFLVLALLERGPATTGEMLDLLERTALEGVEGVGRDALKDACASLVARRLIAVQANSNEEPTGAEPIYTITEHGREASRRWMRASLSARAPGPELRSAFLLLLFMPAEESLAELEHRRDMVRDEVTRLEGAADGSDHLANAVRLLERRLAWSLALSELDWLTLAIRDVAAHRGPWVWSDKGSGAGPA